MKRADLLSRVARDQPNIRFHDFLDLARGFGFEVSRTRGSHHILKHPNTRELLNLQNVKGEAKPHQIRQLLRLVEKYSLILEDER